MGRRAWIGAMAAGGVVVTHLLTFALLAPDAHARAELLHRSGHGSFTLLAAIGIGLLTAAAAHTALTSTRPNAPAPGHRLGTAAVAVRLAAAQAVGWLALEAAERLVHAGAHWEPRVFAVGLVVQAAVAVAGALLLRAVHHGVAALARRLRRPARPRHAAANASPRPRRSHDLPSLRPALLAGASGLRGPPSAS